MSIPSIWAAMAKYSPSFPSESRLAIHSAHWLYEYFSRSDNHSLQIAPVGVEA